ncbi:interleukin-13 receptor subunit alpha-1-like isoform X2 [Engystomops pustulosus]
MIDMFHLMFKWDSSDANCTQEYTITLLTFDPKDLFVRVIEKTWVELKIDLIYHQLDINNITATIKAKCNDKSSESVTKSHLQLAPGDREAVVRNVTCVWHYMDTISCTWLPREDTPSNIQYRLFYWENPKTLPESPRLQDLVHSGTECQDYFPSDGTYSGCKFRFEYMLKDSKQLMFAVTDASYTAKPFLYFAKANDIVKFRSPVITHVQVNGTYVYINWTMSPHHMASSLPHGFIFEVHDGWNEPKQIYNALYTSIPYTGNTLRIKVRVKFSPSSESNIFWSDWSKESVVEGKDKTTTSILLLILIPVVVIILAVLLLVYLKRLKILICPPIPNPGKIFQHDFNENWLKSRRSENVCNKPKEEEISPVSLLVA